jgi:hypothetical protein
VKKLLFIFLSANLSCIQITDNVENKGHDTITDPVTPVHFDINYNPIVNVTPVVFPEGSTGVGALRIFIDTTLRVKKFKILSARINNGRNEIYNYISDKEKRETLQLTDTLAELVKNIKIKKIGNQVLKALEAYDIAIKFK